jgi:hypothetical protein
MCCFTTIFLVLGSRIALIVWWLSDPQRFSLAFKNWVLPGIAFPAWVWTVLGGIFLPWTTLAYLYVYPGGVVGYEWIVLGVGLLIDLAGHGGGYYHRHRIPRRR